MRVLNLHPRTIVRVLNLHPSTLVRVLNLHPRTIVRVLNLHPSTLVRVLNLHPRTLVQTQMQMIGLTSEITDEVSFGRRGHYLHLCPQMNQAR